MGTGNEAGWVEVATVVKHGWVEVECTSCGSASTVPAEVPHEADGTPSRAASGAWVVSAACAYCGAPAAPDSTVWE